MMKARIKRSTVAGFITPPPSKSHTLRAILFASLARGRSHISNYLESPDTRHMIDACRLLGAVICIENGVIAIDGVEGKPQIPVDVINCGNSGQILRFVGAIAGHIPGFTILTGDESIRLNRPVKPLLKGLKDLGAFAESSQGNNKPPLIVKGKIKPGVVRISGEDSQPVSGFLIAASLLEGKTTIFVENPGEKPWIDLTLHWLDKLGIRYSNKNYCQYEVEGVRAWDGFDYTVPSDFSSASYLIAAALVTGSALTLQHIDMQDPQGDKMLIEVLRQMGAHITYNQSEKTLQISPSELSGIEIDVNGFIDAITLLAVIGCYAKGETVIKNGKIARCKESDRIHAICAELKKMGALITEQEEGMVVRKSSLKGCALRSYSDHRIIMSLSIAALFSEGETVIEDVAWVKKSYPSFFEHLKTMGADISTFLLT